MNCSSYGEMKADFFLMIPPPYYEDNDIVNKTVINEVYPVLIPQIAKDLGIADDHVLNLFEIMGGANLTKYELFCDG